MSGVFKATLDSYSPINETIVTDSGFRYLDTRSVVKSTKDIESETEVGLFEQFDRLNNKLRYCNGTYYKFQDKNLEQRFSQWIRSADYKSKSFDLYYGNGIVD